MAFDKRVFTDGESSYDVPYWRQVIEHIDTNVDTFNYKEEFAQRRRIQENEVGLKHPNNNSFIKIKDDGTIEIFAGDGGGVRLFSDNRLQLFGNIQIIGNSFQGLTPENQASFNTDKLSGEYPDIQEKGKTESFKRLFEELKGE